MSNFRFRVVAASAFFALLLGCSENQDVVVSEDREPSGAAKESEKAPNELGWSSMGELKEGGRSIEEWNKAQQKKAAEREAQ